MIGLRLSLVMGFSLGALVMLGSGCDPEVARGPCSRPGAPAACNTECSELALCPTGFYCSDALRCTADCSPEVACRGTVVCGDDGRCGGPILDGGRDAEPLDAPLIDYGPPRDSPTSDGACASVRVETQRSTPNVILIIDQSGSMGMERFPPGAANPTRWDALSDALIGIDPGPGGFIDDLDSSVRFGLVTYRQEPGIPGCPDLRGEIPALINNYTTIRGVYTALSPGGATPTGDAIAATLASISTYTAAAPDQPTIFILATDGEPNTCENSTDTVGGRLESIAAIQSAFTAGIKTYVISVGTDTEMTHLNDLANAGQGVASGATPYVATDIGTLGAALTSIIGSVASCNIELMGRLDTERACTGTVTLDGRVLTCDDPDGWRAVDESHIELLGSACSELQSAGGTLNASFPCEVIILD